MANADSRPGSAGAPGGASRLTIAVSACLLGEPVRYDGQLKTCPAVCHGLARRADLLPLCPETGAGMPVPREPVDLFGDAAAPRMRGVSTGMDWTDRVNAWIEAALDRCADAGVAGFVLKARSPSCGIGDAALHATPGAAPVGTDGLLAAAIRRRFPRLPLAPDEGLDVEEFLASARQAVTGDGP